MAKKSAKKHKSPKVTEFEMGVIASCLASKLERNEYSVEASLTSLESDLAAWRKLARAAEQALRG
jgi:hypothetical protein